MQDSTKSLENGGQCRRKMGKKRKSPSMGDGSQESSLKKKKKKMARKKKKKNKNNENGKNNAAKSGEEKTKVLERKKEAEGPPSSSKHGRKRKKRNKRKGKATKSEAKKAQKQVPSSSVLGNLDPSVRAIFDEATEHFESRNGTLSDWLNPSHPHFWESLKAAWSKLPKSLRKTLVERDQKACRAQLRAPEHPFPTASDDHCETAPEAYAHIAPILKLIARELGKELKDLRIYDPYFCDGAVVRNLGKLGFSNVYNKCEDFYEMERDPPLHDVIVTNPPYSSDHVERLTRFVARNGKPSLLLMPNYVYAKSFFPEKKFVYIVPRKRYVYWTPKGLRPKNKLQNHASSLGVRTSPFVSFWYVTRNCLTKATQDGFCSTLRTLYSSKGSSKLSPAVFVKSVERLPKNARAS
mmetsp:Transcript_38414/g.62442  ORF Transcript_38414/g.62442 Transcript_38414/m.62442 type:complete len:409 (+) Transcript_38414:107-1333(+)